MVPRHNNNSSSSTTGAVANLLWTSLACIKSNNNWNSDATATPPLLSSSPFSHCLNKHLIYAQPRLCKQVCLCVCLCVCLRAALLINHSQKCLPRPPAAHAAGAPAVGHLCGCWPCSVTDWFIKVRTKNYVTYTTQIHRQRDTLAHVHLHRLVYVVLTSAVWIAKGLDFVVTSFGD